MKADIIQLWLKSFVLYHRYLIHIDAKITVNWYPKSFAEKIDHILLYIYSHAPHLGQTVYFSMEQLYIFLFIERYELSSGKPVLRSDDDLLQEGYFMLSCFAEKGHLQNYIGMRCNDLPPLPLCQD